MESLLFAEAANLRQTGDFGAAIDRFKELAGPASDFVAGFQRTAVARSAVARYILRELERARRRTEEVSVEGADSVHVEHIYPRSPSANPWDDHDRFVHRIGNLTLLDRILNVSIRNADFATKKKEAYSKSELLITKDLLAYENWTPEDIEQRQTQLSALAFDVWKFPGEARPLAEDVSADLEPSERDDVEALPIDHLPSDSGD